MKRKLSGIIAMILIIIVSIVFTSCGSSEINSKNGKANTEAAQENSIEKIKKSGKLIVGTCADYPPYEFHKVANGNDEIVGFDITIAKEIAKDLGVKLEISDMKFDGLLAALNAGKIDIVIAGMVPTEERKKSVDFSKVYYNAVQSVMVRAEDFGTLKTIADLADKKVGVQMSTTQEDIAKKQMVKSKIKSLGKVTDLILELKSKKVDALIVERPVAQSYADKNPDIVISDIKVENENKGSAVAVKKGSDELVQTINNVLDKLMNENQIDKFVADANNMVE